MGLIASMESIEDEVAPSVETQEEVTAVAVADESAEIQADSAEIGTTVTEVEQAVQAGDELEVIADQVDDAIESGEGLDEKTAEMASIAIESIRNRLGDYSPTRLVAARESFGNSNTRLASTRLIKEGIADTLKKIWTAVKQAAVRVWEMIKSFFAKLFNSASLLQKNIASLKARANAMPSGVAPKDKKIKTGLAKAIGIKGVANMSTFDQIGKNTMALAGVAMGVSKATRDIVGAAEKLAKAPEINEAAVSAFVKEQAGASGEMAKIMNAAFSTAETVLGSDAGAVVEQKKKQKKASGEVRAFGPFVGSTVLVMCVEKDAESARFSMSFEGTQGKKAEEVEALSLSEVKSVLAQAGSLANNLADFKKTQSEMDTIVKQVNSTADVILNNAAKMLEKSGSSSETRQGLADLKATVNDSIGMLSRFGNQAPSYVFALAKAGADYASVSMRNLKEK